MNPVDIRLLTFQEAASIPPDSLPLIALSDRLGFLGWRIRAHSKGFYSHAMAAWRTGFLGSQEWHLVDSPAWRFLTPAHRLKFWGCTAWTETNKSTARRLIAQDLAEGRRHHYDWLGILGQALGMTGLQFPGRWYCSEWVGRVLTVLDPRVSAWLARYPHPTPADLDRYFTANQAAPPIGGGYFVYGIFDPGLGS